MKPEPRAGPTSSKAVPAFNKLTVAAASGALASFTVNVMAKEPLDPRRRRADPAWLLVTGWALGVTNELSTSTTARMVMAEGGTPSWFARAAVRAVVSNDAADSSGPDK